ncbi:MAG: hypothetical protein P8125_05355 [Gemmatimonadota bacterium]
MKKPTRNGTSTGSLPEPGGQPSPESDFASRARSGSAGEIALEIGSVPVFFLSCGYG